jgi:hypothetical protein
METALNVMYRTVILASLQTHVLNAQKASIATFIVQAQLLSMTMIQWDVSQNVQDNIVTLASRLKLERSRLTADSVNQQIVLIAQIQPQAQFVMSALFQNMGNPSSPMVQCALRSVHMAHSMKEWNAHLVLRIAMIVFIQMNAVIVAEDSR